MGLPVIDWVHEKCKSWGRTKAAILWAEERGPQSIMGRIVREGFSGACIRGKLPAPPEVMVGDALEVSVAITLAMSSCLKRGRRLTAEQYEALFVYYVVRGMLLKEKARRLGVGSNAIIQRVDRAQRHIMPFMKDRDPDGLLKALGVKRLQDP